MDKRNLFTATVLVAALTIPTIANSALVGRLADSNGNYQAYYDTEADLTWLADANYAQTSGYNENGLMHWPDAMAWATDLNIDGVTGWRLPDTNFCTGYSCSSSEMGNLFFNVLDGTTYDIGNTTYNANYDLFSNVQSSGYWSATKQHYSLNPSRVYYFNMDTGLQGVGYTSSQYFYAWAVQSGDVDTVVSTVPLPASLWLFSFGLIGLIKLARKD